MGKILVSGSEGDIARSIAVTLREIGCAESVIGCDMQEAILSPYYFDEWFQVPRAADENYLSFLSEFICANQIAMFIPTAEAEIEVLAEMDDVDGTLGCRVAIVGRDVARNCLDKLATAECLKRHSLAAPLTLELGQSGDVGFPCIVKPRKGRGSMGIQIVNSANDLAERRQSDATGYIMQELIGSAEEEYTVGLFVSSSGESRALSLRRTLDPSTGATACGEVADLPEVLAYASAVGKAIGLVGAANVQLRVGPRGPTAFEINPRFSSTLRFRHLLGFKDLQWVLEDLSGKPVSDYEPPVNGTRFYRRSTEVLLED